MPTDKTQVKTFYPKTPVEFSSSLLAELDNTNESNYTRQQYVKQYIEKEVAERLKELESDKRVKFDDALKKSLLKSNKDTDNVVSVASLNGKLDQTYTKLKALNEFHPMRTPQVEKAEKKVASCLKNHKGEPLNCWQQVEQFKKLASSL
ncbi:hypothetical protein FOA43_002063 [Brettanomyces nanus]|uniref:Uncharacterized protein n=1 Tax=Eeniella nana TaxID=13502 RepID=A0A875RP88_EENNA|nr:uncharacterized protein FOA43_002063 [Brettanomyces nanus]QPG74730.1 hypothetical protein FOA43_002063 [Brettanomyces nanus]